VDARSLARLHAAGRIVTGAALTVAPGLAGRTWIGRAAGTAGARVALTAMGARDLGLGLGELRALSSPRPRAAAAPWLVAGAFADATDLIATIRARHALPLASVAGVTALASTGVALAAWLHHELPRAAP
jgi:hypothetical protein